MQELFSAYSLSPIELSCSFPHLLLYFPKSIRHPTHIASIALRNKWSNASLHLAQFSQLAAHTQLSLSVNCRLRTHSLSDTLPGPPWLTPAHTMFCNYTSVARADERQYMKKCIHTFKYSARRLPVSRNKSQKR